MYTTSQLSAVPLPPNELYVDFPYAPPACRMTKTLALAWVLALVLAVAIPRRAVAQGVPLASPASSTVAAGQQVSAAPWRVGEALHVPAWLRLGIEHRSRWERLGDDFRAGPVVSPVAYALRTLATAEVQAGSVAVLAEAADVRAYTSAGTPLSNTIINPFDLLQGQLTLRRSGLWLAGDQARLTLGRMTVDLGSRRLLARNEFRNTINAFDGLDGQWTAPSGWTLRLLALAPVQRRPLQATDLAAHVMQADVVQQQAALAVLWWSGPLPQGVQLEAFVVGLYERDHAETATADRRLLTPTLRLVRPPAAGQLDGQLEASLQVGRSRATSKATDSRDLDHLAAALHMQLGYRWSAVAQPRLSAFVDYGSGDADPSDDRNGRFDTLFGARRFDFGPTGLYGALARSNLVAPGVRVEVAAGSRAEAMLAWRSAWTDEARDAWTTAGLRDATGQSGRGIGQQLDGRVRWHVWPRNLSLELGGAVLWRSGMAAVLGTDRGHPLYTYVQLTGVM